MTLGFRLGYDATTLNVDHLPLKAQVAGYDTGDNVAWTDAQFARFDKPLHICQRDSETNPSTSDYIDMERFAATPEDVVKWYPEAVDSFNKGLRPGQRWPSVYVSANNVPTLLNALRASGIRQGPGLIIAHWLITETQAELTIEDAVEQDYPVNGVQFANGQFYDVDLYLTSWLNRVSAPKASVFWLTSAAGETINKIAADRDANAANMLRRTVQYSDSLNLAMLGEALLRPGTQVATVNP